MGIVKYEHYRCCDCGYGVNIRWDGRSEDMPIVMLIDGDCGIDRKNEHIQNCPMCHSDKIEISGRGYVRTFTEIMQNGKWVARK